MTAGQPLRVAVIGAGHMGRHHARTYRRMQGVELVAVVDTDVRRAEGLCKEYGGRALASVEQLDESVQAASLAVPTHDHQEVAKALFQRGVDVLVEKPLAESLAAAQRIADAAAAHNRIMAVGHTERFNPVVAALQRMKVVPKFIETHRISPFSFRSADIGVVLDMMIHDIDIVLSLVADEPTRVDAVGVNVLGPHEDIANARVTFAGGCVANLTASRLALKRERKIRVFSEQAYLSLDFQRPGGIAITKDANLDILRLAREKGVEDLAALAGTDYGAMIKVEPLAIDASDPLQTELEAFTEAVRTRSTPPAGPAEALAAMRLADAILTSIRSHRWDGTADGRVGLDEAIVTLDH